MNHITFILRVLIGVIIIVAAGPTASKVYAEETNGREYHIAQDGTMDFSTIQEGVDYAGDGDTLVIHPGTYNESVTVWNKELYLVGVDRESCVIQCDSTDYRKVPLAIAAGGVSNLTIVGLDTGIETPVMDEVLKNYTGYAIHVEQDFLFYKKLCFSNCNIISQNNYCVGIGSRGGCEIVFEDCELTAVGIGGCVLMHDSVIGQFAGEAGLVMRNCSLKSYFCPYVMAFQSLAPKNSFRLTFQNVKISAMAYADDTIYLECNQNTGHTIEELADLEKSGELKVNRQLVHMLNQEASIQYMAGLLPMYAAKAYADIMALRLPEGIVYIDEGAGRISRLKHQVIDIENDSGQPEDGWCGLRNAYLTSDSYGNTLPDMNSFAPND